MTKKKFSKNHYFLAIIILSVIAAFSVYDYSTMNKTGRASMNYLSLQSTSSSLSSGWPYTENSIGAQNGDVIIDDLDNDGSKEIIMHSFNNQNKVYVFSNDGMLLPGWPVIPNLDTIITSIATGDINGNGQKDIVVTMYDSLSRETEVFLYDYNGNTVGVGTLTITRSDGYVVLEDYNSDGVLDIIISSSDPLNAGLGKVIIFNYLGVVIDSYSIPENSRRVAVSDIDGDGRVEIVGRTVGQTPNNNIFIIKNGIITYKLIPDFRLIGEITLADIDKDGMYKEILTYAEGTGNPTHYLAAFDHNLNELWKKTDVVTTVPISWSSQDVVVSNIDSDCELEILIYSHNDAYTLVEVENNGTGNVTTERNYTSRIFAFNHDGTPVPGWPVTIQGSGNNGGKAVLLTGSIDNDLENEVMLTYTVRMFSIPDNYKDYVGAWNSDGTVSVGFPIYTGDRLNDNFIPTDIIALDDTDADNFAELLLLQTKLFSNGAQNLKLDSMELGQFGGVSWPMFRFDAKKTGSYPLSGRCCKLYDETSTRFDVVEDRSTNDVKFIDVDNDNDMDIIDANSAGCSSSWTNDGNGFFTYDYQTRMPCVGNVIGMDIGDADGDVDPDICFATPLFDKLLINENLFTGIYDDESSTRLPQINEYSNDVLFVDVDSDGDKDIFVANGLNLKNRLFINNGAGFYIDQSIKLPNNFYMTNAAAAGDFDSDGDMDIIAGTAFGQPDEYLINDGTGTFTNSILLFSGSDTTNDVEAFDADNDGDLDVVFAESGMDKLLINDGTGTFSDETPARLSTYNEQSEEYTVADFNKDGYLDLFLVNHPSTSQLPAQTIRLFINKGQIAPGRFIETTNFMLSPSNLPIDTNGGRAVDSADIENDGDMDVYIGIADLGMPNRQNRIYTNYCSL